MRRSVWAVSLSLLLHLVPALLLSSLSLLEKLLPPPPVTWEIVPAKRPTPPPLVTPESTVVPPPPKPTEPTPKSGQTQRGDAGGKLGKPTAAKPPPLPSLHGIGAPSIEQDLGVRLVLRMGEVAKSPHRASVASLLGSFPDSRLLVAGSPLATGDALAEALLSSSDVLVVATTDPTGYRRSQTALVALGKKLKPLFEQLTSRRVPTWDDRELLFDAPDLMAFLPRPDPVVSPSSDADRPDAFLSEPPSLASQLPALRRALPKSGPPLVAEIFNLQGRLRLRGGIPTPRHVQLSLSADLDPQVRGRMVLSSQEEAIQLREAMATIGEKLRNDWRFKLMGISTLLDHLQLEPKGNELQVSGFLTGAALRSLLGVAAGALQVLPSGAPPPPPDLLPPLVDAGVDAQ